LAVGQQYRVPEGDFGRNFLSHNYVLQGAELSVERAPKLLRTLFTFAIWDPKSKAVIYCIYSQNLSDEEDAAQKSALLNSDNPLASDTSTRIGLGRPSDHSVAVSKTLDFNDIVGSTGALSLMPGKGSQNAVTATIKLDKSHVLLRFQLVVDGVPSNLQLNTRGYIAGNVDTAKQRPKVNDVLKALGN
jgi:hypothetical protein